MIATPGFLKWKPFHLRRDDLVRELRLGTTILLGLGVLVLVVPSAHAQITLEGVLTCPPIANTSCDARLTWLVDGQPIASDYWQDVAHCTTQPANASGWQVVVTQYDEFGGIINSCSKSGSFQAGHAVNLTVNCGGRQLGFRLRKGKAC